MGRDIIAAASYPDLIRICLSNGSNIFGGKGCFDVLLFAFRFWTLEMFLKREIEREEREERDKKKERERDGDGNGEGGEREYKQLKKVRAPRKRRSLSFSLVLDTSMGSLSRILK